MMRGGALAVAVVAAVLGAASANHEVDPCLAAPCPYDSVCEALEYPQPSMPAYRCRVNVVGCSAGAEFDPWLQECVLGSPRGKYALGCGATACCPDA